jgi:hypothetical protein
MPNSLEHLVRMVTQSFRERYESVLGDKQKDAKW